MRIELKRGNDQIVTLPGLRLVSNGQFLNAAVVTATLYDSKGVVVPSVNQVTMEHVPDSNGDYLWPIDGHTLMLSPSTQYTLVITAREDEKDFRASYEVTITN